MSKSIKKFLSLLLVLQLIIPYSVFAAAIGEFTSVVGEVTQTRAKEVIKPVVKSPIQLKDIIVTDQASSVMMVFSDDSTIKLEQNTKLEIKEFLFKEKSRTGIFSLAIGKLTAGVSKFIGGDNIFEVHSVTAVAGVRGTGFEFIESMEGGEPTATVICTEGSLTISALSPAGVIIATEVLLAGQTAVIKGGIITISATIAGAAAAAATGLSTGAKIGIVAGALALTGGVAAVAAGSSGGGGGDGGTSSGGTTTVTSRNVQICVVDSNSVQDDFYDLYVNGTYLGPVKNVVGGTTCYPATLVSGNNTILLKLTEAKGYSTYLKITADPGGWSEYFGGTYDHSWTITAP
ncbi:MAG: hypothetical protein A2168_04120 [Planctomycetes bacterium RBG_13_50_24]|nr:MAG: hypothetical protein A2168_04120 [Planctomycetes bacterium RBG_13_50_24]